MHPCNCGGNCGDTCRCCEPSAAPTPAVIYNRPGLPAIRYRIGTYGSFLASMVQGIARQPALRAWTTRSEDDYGIVTLEMWAYVADILTFYQERAANEAYLRTALHWDSVLRLVALLDYEPASGLAAVTHLALFADAGARVLVPVGLRVQSVPGQDEKPQKFETVESLWVDARYNERTVYGEPRPRTPLAEFGSTHGILHPDRAAVLAAELAAGQNLAVFRTGIGGSVEEKQVDALDTVDWQRVLRWSPPMRSSQSGARMYRWERKLRLFGHDAPARTLAATLHTPSSGSQYFTWSQTDTPFDIAAGTTTLDLDRLVDDLEAGTLLLVVAPTFVHLTEATAVEQVDATRGGVTGTVTRVRLAAGLPAQIANLRQAFVYTLTGSEVVFWPFAYPDVVQGDTLYVRLADLGTSLLEVEDLTEPQTLVETLQAALRRYNAGIDEEGDALALYVLWNLTSSVQARVALYDGIAPPDDDLLSDLVQDLNLLLRYDTSLYDAGRFAHVELDDALRGLAVQAMTFGSGDARLIRLNRLLLEKAYPALLRRTSAFEDVASGRRLILLDGKGTPLRATVEAVQPMDTVSDGRHVVLTVEQPLPRSLNAGGAKLYGNVVEATHGETVDEEVLGSGDAAADFQRFVLQKSPVTFVPNAEAEHGAANTLTVRVGGVAWTEVPTLYGQPPDAEVYTTREDADGGMIVQFGDGRTGARLPTGRNNVTARYRQGLGPDGNLPADRLTTLLDRPKGLKRATNPDAARGGAEGEDLADARTNAPNSVRIFDRIVSLRDFEDAARAYSGVAKARASWVWDGEEQAVHLIVAGDDGALIEQETKENLVAYLDARRDPNRTMRVVPHRNVPVRVSVAIAVDPRHEADAVAASVRAALQDFFSFERRGLGQPVHLSDVYQVAHDVEGVVAADVNELQYKRTPDRLSHGATTAPVQEHLRLRLNELASITNALNDITVTVGLAE